MALPVTIDGLNLLTDLYLQENLLSMLPDTIGEGEGGGGRGEGEAVGEEGEGEGERGRGGSGGGGRVGVWEVRKWVGREREGRVTTENRW